MERSNIFVDSNYFIGLFNPADTLHKRVEEIASEFEAKKTMLIISNFVFLETVTVIAQRRNKIIAIEAGKYLKNDSFIEIIHIDEILQEKSWEIFQEIAKKDVSFVDCSNIALMRAEGIDELLTFDVSDFKSLQKQYKFRFYESKRGETKH